MCRTECKNRISSLQTRAHLRPTSITVHNYVDMIWVYKLETSTRRFVMRYNNLVLAIKLWQIYAIICIYKRDFIIHKQYQQRNCTLQSKSVFTICLGTYVKIGFFFFHRLRIVWSYLSNVLTACELTFVACTPKVWLLM